MTDERLEFKVERDVNLLNGDDLARIRYRRDGVRKWQSFVVVLDEEMTYEMVEETAVLIIGLYAAGYRAERAT